MLGFECEDNTSDAAFMMDICLELLCCARGVVCITPYHHNFFLNHRVTNSTTCTMQVWLATYTKYKTDKLMWEFIKGPLASPTTGTGKRKWFIHHPLNRYFIFRKIQRTKIKTMYYHKPAALDTWMTKDKINKAGSFAMVRKN